MVLVFNYLHAVQLNLSRGVSFSLALFLHFIECIHRDAFNNHIGFLQSDLHTDKHLSWKNAYSYFLKFEIWYSY